MKPYFLLLLISNLNGFPMLAKQRDRTTDSLKKLIATSLKDPAQLPDTATISRIDKLASKYFVTYPDSTLYYGALEIRLSKKINYLLGVANGSSQLATVNTFRGNYDESGKNYNIALKIYQKLNHKKGISDSFNGLGRIQDYLGNYDNAIRLYQKALALCIKTPDDTDEGKCYNLMGITYDNKGDFSKALDCYFKALLINIKHKDQSAAASKYNNIGIVMQELELYPKALIYYNSALTIWEKLGNQQGISGVCQGIGDMYIAQKDYKRAIGYINRASAIFHRLNDSEGLSLVYYDLGLYHYYAKHTDTAIYYLNLSLQSTRENKIKYIKAYAYIGLAMVYNMEKKYQPAYNYAAKAQLIARKLNSLLAMTDAALQASIASAGLGNFEEAYHKHEVYSALKSDLKKNESVNKAMLYNVEIDFAKKQNEFTEREHQKEKVYQKKIAHQTNENLISAAIIIILTFIALVYYNAKSKQQKINQLLAEKNKEIVSQQENLNTQAAKLNELNTLKDRLIGVLAHDLRAPISTLRGLFHLMTDTSITQQEFIEMTPRVFNTLEHTSDFLDTLLFWINSQVDGSNNKTKSFLLKDLVNRELIHLEDKIKQKNITVHLKIAPDTVALADPNSVRIVIHNFLTNAIKFSNRNGIIEISAWLQDDKGVEFCLKDHGVGMSTEYLNTLFKSQVISSTGTENESGTGMGLLFCKDLIEKQNGKIWAKSNLGVGTELCFMLPAGDKTKV